MSFYFSYQLLLLCFVTIRYPVCRAPASAACGVGKPAGTMIAEFTYYLAAKVALFPILCKLSWGKAYFTLNFSPAVFDWNSGA